VYSAIPALGASVKLLRVGLYVNNGIAAGIDSYLAQMGSQVGMHQCDMTLVGNHDIQGSLRCLYEGIAGRGTYAAPAGLLAADAMTEYRTDAIDSNGAQVVQTGYMQFQCEVNATPGIVPTGIYFGTMNAAGARDYRWMIQNSGLITPFLNNTYDIGFNGLAPRRIVVATAYAVGANDVVNTRKTGYTNAMTGTKNRATAYATGTITLIQLAERVGAIQDDLTTHGLIGV
jgi:hypothetical protein